MLYSTFIAQSYFVGRNNDILPIAWKHLWQFAWSPLDQKAPQEPVAWHLHAADVRRIIAVTENLSFVHSCSTRRAREPVNLHSQGIYRRHFWMCAQLDGSVRERLSQMV